MVYYDIIESLESIILYHSNYNTNKILNIIILRYRILRDIDH